MGVYTKLLQRHQSAWESRQLDLFQQAMIRPVLDLFPLYGNIVACEVGFLGRLLLGVLRSVYLQSDGRLETVEASFQYAKV